MAGEWIKVRTNLWNDPRVSQLCDQTKSPEAMIVGGLYWLWATADEHTETGLMPGLSVGAIDRKTGITGFGAALVDIGWVLDTPAGIILARFDEHNGASAKQRAQTAKRVANSRNSGNVTQQSEIGNAPTVTGALPREEKRREEKKVETTTSDTTEGSKKKSATGSRLPADWKPSAEDIEYCKTQRPELRPSLVATNFYDYWIAKAGAAGRKMDWSATWRSWVRKESAVTAGRAIMSQRGGQQDLDEQRRKNNEEAKRLLGFSTTPSDDERTIDAT